MASSTSNLSSQGGLVMIIADSSIHLSSDRTAIQAYHKKETLTYWNSGKDRHVQMDEVGLSQKSTQSMQLISDSVKVSLSPESRQTTSLPEIKNHDVEEIGHDLNLKLLKAMIERITGRKVQVFRPGGSHEESLEAKAGGSAKDPATVPESSGFGLAYDLHESYFESESTSFSATGKIMTADGVAIDFTLDMRMNRQFYEENNISIRLGDALKDPLVINFEGNAVSLTDTKFFFDIDADGVSDKISFVGVDSGLLVLDKNGDGIVNDGSELFGAISGEGFKELAGHDEDNNGWIDAADSVYEKLMVWVKDIKGEDQLFTLGEKGIGAIYLNNISSSFDLKSEENEMLGRIRSTGIFIGEDHTIGTVQQIDLAV